MEHPEIDPVKYGALYQKVQDYERRFEVVDKKLDKMEHQLDELLALANKGRGGFWAGSSLQPSYGMIGNASLRFGIRVDSVDVDVAELLAAGVVLVGAAGNYYQTIDVLGGLDYDNFFNQGATPLYYMRGGSPASATGVICVGNVSTGTDTPEEKLGSSESGPRVDVWAHGTNIVSTTSTTNDFGATTAYPLNSNYKIMSISGTSMASPQVAGLAAVSTNHSLIPKLEGNLKMNRF